jgi:hypothetical protein
MIPVFSSFLPPTHPHLYIPALFKIWEAFNSSVIDDRLIDLAGDLSEEHVAGTAGSAGQEGGAEWKYAGIWTEDQWTMLIGQGLASMSACNSFGLRVWLLRLTDFDYLCRYSRWSHQGKVITKILEDYHMLIYFFVGASGLEHNCFTCRRDGR